VCAKYFQLTHPIKFNEHQQPAMLPTRDMKKNDPLTIATWGSTGLGKPVHDHLQKLESKCMLPDQCRTYHKGFMNIYDHEFCTLISFQTGNCHVRNYNDRILYIGVHCIYYCLLYMFIFKFDVLPI